MSCYPDKTDLKKLKEEANRKKACMHDCTNATFEPVCAGKHGEKPKSFGSECVMNNYNCENKESEYSKSSSLLDCSNPANFILEKSVAFPY